MFHRCMILSCGAVTHRGLVLCRRAVPHRGVILGRSPVTHRCVILSRRAVTHRSVILGRRAVTHRSVIFRSHSLSAAVLVVTVAARTNGRALPDRVAVCGGTLTRNSSFASTPGGRNQKNREPEKSSHRNSVKLSGVEKHIDAERSDTPLVNAERQEGSDAESIQKRKAETYVVIAAHRTQRNEAPIPEASGYEMLHSTVVR
jgi:hypothetical protein